MSAVSLPTPGTAAPTVRAEELHARRGRRQVVNAIMIGLMGLSFVVVLIPLVFVLGTVVSRGGGIVVRGFPAWFTKTIPPSERRFGPGMGPAIVGTLLITGLASAISIPLGILGAVYLNEYGRTSLGARIVRFFANVMTGVPSIVMGLFVYIVFTLQFKQSGLGGALALACLMLPIVIRSTEEMLRLVPDHLREASYALGSRKSRTVLGVVLPTAAPGIVSGCLLAVARAAGETAPLLFTVGAATWFNRNVFKDVNTALPMQIFTNALSGKPGAVERGWGAALTLVTLTFVLTVIARVVTARYQRRR